MKHSRQDMLSGPLLPSIVSYTVPIILTGLLQLLFNAADLVVVGTRGEIYLSAVGATNAITNLIVNLFIGLSVGAGVTMAHAMGCRDQQAIHRTVHTALPTAFVGGVVLTVVGIALSETLLRWMETPETVLPHATRYMRIYFGGMVFNMVYNFGAALLRAAGDTRGPLVYLTIAGVANVVLNMIFVLVFGMTVDGVALATIISQGISAVLVVRALMCRTDAARLILKKLRIYKPQILKIVRLGLPAGIQGSLFSISKVLIQSSINSFGEVFMAGSTASHKDLAKGIDGRLDQHLGNREQRSLDASRQAQADDLEDLGLIDPELFQNQTGCIRTTHQGAHHQNRGYSLGNNGGQGNTVHSHTEDQHEDHIQHHIGNTGNG